MWFLQQNCGNSYTINGLKAGSSYLFKVGGCGKNGFSNWSKKVKIGLPQNTMSFRQGHFRLQDNNSVELNGELSKCDLILHDFSVWICTLDAVWKHCIIMMSLKKSSCLKGTKHFARMITAKGQNYFYFASVNSFSKDRCLDQSELNILPLSFKVIVGEGNYSD